MADPATLRLLSWLSPAFPTGGFAYSHGVEWAVESGDIKNGLDRFDESIPIYRRALAFQEQRFGPDHFEVAATLNNLGMALANQGNIEEARQIMARALAIKQYLFAADHPEVVLTRRNFEAVTSL